MDKELHDLVKSIVALQKEAVRQTLLIWKHLRGVLLRDLISGLPT